MSKKKPIAVAITVKSRWKINDYPEPGGRQAALVHPNIGTVTLPWWPEDIENGDLARAYSEFSRPGRAPLLTPEARPLDTYQMSFSLLPQEYDSGNVAEVLDALKRMADATKPVSLVLAKSARGLFHITAMTFTERDHTARGNPRWVDVSMTLKRASDFTVKVGPVARGIARGVSREI